MKQPDEFADDAALPAELWEPQTISASLSIGKILKLDSIADLVKKEENHDDSDPGTGPGLTAG